MAEAFLRFVGWLIGAIVATLMEALIFSAFPKRGMSAGAWWSGKTIAGKLMTCLSWLFWAVVIVGAVVGLAAGLIEKAGKPV